MNRILQARLAGEAVTWVAGLPDLSYSFFFLHAFLLDLRAKDGANTRCRPSIARAARVVAAHDWITRDRVPNSVRAARHLPLGIDRRVREGAPQPGDEALLRNLARARASLATSGGKSDVPGLSEYVP